MRIEIATDNASLTWGRLRLVKGKAEEVDDKEGAKMLASGLFRVATDPAPDPHLAEKDRAKALIDRLAASGGEVMAKLERLLMLAESEAVADAVAGKTLVNNDEPRSSGSSVLDDEGADELENMTVPQLRALARSRGVDLGKARNKQDIVAVLTGAE